MKDKNIKDILSKLEKASRDRNLSTDKASKAFQAQIKALQKDLAALFVTTAAQDLTFEDGRIVLNASNITALTATIREIAKQYDAEMQKITEGVIASMDDITKSADKYFKILDKGIPDYASKVRLDMDKRLGIDNLKPVRGGYVISALTGAAPLDVLKTAALKTMARGASQKEFMSTMTEKITGGNGLGIIEAHHVQTEVSDLFDRYERTYSHNMAKEAGLDKARYSGGLMTTSRPFCVERQGKVFTREEIEAWASLSWQGKPGIYDPFVDLGGYNCRHTLDWVTDELAKEWETEDSSNQPQVKAPEIPAAVKTNLTKYEKELGVKLDPSIFKLTDPKVTFDVPVVAKKGRSPRAGFIPSTNTVRIPLDDRRRNSTWYGEAVCYHEFGHSIDQYKGMRTGKETKELMKKYRVELSKNKNKGYKEAENRLLNLHKYALKINNSELLEKVGAVLDTIKSLNIRFGAGHSNSYFRMSGMAEAEFIAHAFENTFKGNDVFKKVLPNLYEDMIRYIQEIK